MSLPIVQEYFFCTEPFWRLFLEDPKLHCPLQGEHFKLIFSLYQSSKAKVLCLRGKCD